MNVAFISLGSGGTMGHMSLTTKLSSTLSKKHKAFLFSDHNYAKFSKTKKPNFRFVKIPSQKHQKTVGGMLNYKHKERLFSKLRKNKINVLIFSTFFDPEILDYCKKKNIKTFMVSYPLRDSHRGAIKERGSYKKFTKVLTLKDIVKTKKLSKKEIIVSPAKEKLKNQKRISKIKNVLVTCGGGGRPSSKKFLEKTEKAAKEINKEFPEINFTVIKGNAKTNLKSSNIKTINWSDNFLDKIKKHELIISEAGYHTIIDLISTCKPGIILPGERRIDNQELRAVEFEKRGLGWSIFPTEDFRKISEKIKELIKNPERLDIKKQNFKKTENEIFSEKNITNALLELLQEPS